MYALTSDPLETTGVCVCEGSQFAEFVDLKNGLVALKTKGGKYVSQVPNTYGAFELRDTVSGYETFGGGTGIGIKTTWTRPTFDPPDQIFSYFCIQLPNVE
jgi:hypothetical protein